MIKSKNRPSGLMYNKDKFVPKLISAYGLCGKALQENYVELSIEHKIAVDKNLFIKNYLEEEIRKFTEILNELNVYNEEIVLAHAKRSTLYKHPYHYCKKCQGLEKYRFNSSIYIVCKNCNKIKSNKWSITKYNNDDVFRFIQNTRSLISISLKNQGYSKKSKTAEILGCDFDTFKTHIERKFTNGMSWSNYGKWHLDHIYPISKATSFEMALKLNHYTNFQPLWAKDNISKNNKLVEHQMILPI
jgi:hypothetical protein